MEDERIARQALETLLGACGYSTDAVASGEAALKVIQTQGVPPIALVDVDLPGMSGLELVTELERIRPDVMTVLVSAADGERIRTFCREHHQVTYVRKPLDFPRLLTLLDERCPAH